MTNKTPTIPDAAVRLLFDWADTAETGHRNDGLLIELANLWLPRNILTVPLLGEDAKGPFVAVDLARPKDAEGAEDKDPSTLRLLDPSALAMLFALLTPGGGRIHVEKHGDDYDFYYLRIRQQGKRGPGATDKQRRVLVLRIIADTPRGQHTREPAVNFKDLRRCNLTLRPKRQAEPRGKHGLSEAIEDALGRFREVAARTPDAKVAGLGEEAYVQLLTRLRRLLNSVPLAPAAQFGQAA